MFSNTQAYACSYIILLVHSGAFLLVVSEQQANVSCQRHIVSDYAVFHAGLAVCIFKFCAVGSLLSLVVTSEGPPM